MRLVGNGLSIANGLFSSVTRNAFPLASSLTMGKAFVQHACCSQWCHKKAPFYSKISFHYAIQSGAWCSVAVA